MKIIMAELPSLEMIVEQVVGGILASRKGTERILPNLMKQLYNEVHLHYHQPGRKERLVKGEVKSAVRAYLEKDYQYVEERDNRPLKPGHSMIVGAYYERKKTEE